MRTFLVLYSSIIFLTGCINPPDYPLEPVITLEGISADTMRQGNLNNDSILVLLSFTDGDGDIGRKDSFDVVLTDLRNNLPSDRYRIPQVPENGANNGISGEITLTIYTTCCVYDNGQPPCTPSNQFPTDQVSFEIYILDRAGNQSNSVITPPITLLCDGR